MFFNANKKDSTTKPSGIWQRLQNGLSKTRTVLFTDITELFDQKDWSEDDLLEEIETRLLMADVGVEATGQIIDGLKQAYRKTRIQTPEQLFELLHQQMVDLLKPIESPLTIPDTPRPFVILVVGVNGAGKTTSIGKLANLYKDQYQVTLAAGDTFRAAAIEQLQTWGSRNKIPVISHSHGADASAVIYDSLQAARNNKSDILIADTAGRLQNKTNLVEELKKIRRTINKFDDQLPVETLLVLDAGNGQNALSQARQFHDAIGISGLVLTKLDGTAKGGIIFALAGTLGIPLRFIGTGEQINDIAAFSAEDFVTALLTRES
ncbi:MAG: signal recognition particle-docking protein FtsY [Gammaproteobacteria bacterium]